MARSLNRATLIGHVVRDPEIISTQSSGNIAKLSIATSEEYKDRNTGERKKKTEYHNLVSFGKLADIICKFVKKGMLLYAEGHLQTNEYEKDGIKRYSTSIILSEIKMLSPKNPENSENHGNQRYSTSKQEEPYLNQEDILDDDIPF